MNNGKTEKQKDGRTEEWPKFFYPTFQYSILPFFQFSLIGRELR
jgi:hypothetical protein